MLSRHAKNPAWFLQEGTDAQQYIWIDMGGSSRDAIMMVYRSNDEHFSRNLTQHFGANEYLNGDSDFSITDAVIISMTFVYRFERQITILT